MQYFSDIWTHGGGGRFSIFYVSRFSFLYWKFDANVESAIGASKRANWKFSRGESNNISFEENSEDSWWNSPNSIDFDSF